MALPSILFFVGALVAFCAAFTKSNSEFDESESDNRQPEKPTFAIMIALIGTYSWILSLGMFFFRGFFNGLTPTKYYLTLGIAISATLYLQFHGRQVIRKHFGSVPDLRKLELSSEQAVYVAIFLIGISAYAAWLFA